MDFSNISNINSYIKTLNMKNIWGQKANNPAKSGVADNPYSVSGGFGNDDPKYTSINNKLEAGENLSDEEMEYLREKYPELYNKAVKLARERKEYAKALRQCKTKDDARMLHMNKISQIMKGDDGGMAKLNMLSKVFTKFTATKEFGKLAANHSELAETRKAEKEAVSGKKEFKAAEKENSENKARKKDVYEPQTPSNRKEQAVKHDNNENDPAQPEYSVKPIHVEVKNPIPTGELKIDRIYADTKPSYVPDRTVTVKANSESSDFEALSAAFRGKLDRHI